MERPQRKRLRLESYDYSQPGSYFITICTRERNQEVLCSIEPAVGAIINRPGRQWRDWMVWVLLVTFKFSLSRPSPMGKVFGCPKR